MRKLFIGLLAVVLLGAVSVQAQTAVKFKRLIVTDSLSGPELTTAQQDITNRYTKAQSDARYASGALAIAATNAQAVATAQAVIATAQAVIATNAQAVATAQASTASAAAIVATNAAAGSVYSWSATATPNANGGTNVVVVTAKDQAGATLAIRAAFDCWIADTEYGVPAAVDGDFVVSGGTEIHQTVDKAVYQVGTAADGTVTITVTDTPGGTNFLHCVSGVGRVSSTEMNFDAP